eukprot:TRINITY_DN8101_c0_g1_i8.p3 TRINITY_DN8101_c0_g1~~TRINITY_DN8101_c0_g1_i8.p3  ORF type:complete len:211 (-),score=-10.50 TRINITY_DN8101_c0_g1_i8:106-738(-)
MFMYQVQCIQPEFFFPRGFCAYFKFSRNRRILKNCVRGKAAQIPFQYCRFAVQISASQQLSLSTNLYFFLLRCKRWQHILKYQFKFATKYQNLLRILLEFIFYNNYGVVKYLLKFQNFIALPFKFVSQKVLCTQTLLQCCLYEKWRGNRDAHSQLKLLFVVQSLAKKQIGDLDYQKRKVSGCNHLLERERRFFVFILLQLCRHKITICAS